MYNGLCHSPGQGSIETRTEKNTSADFYSLNRASVSELDLRQVTCNSQLAERPTGVIPRAVAPRRVRRGRLSSYHEAQISIVYRRLVPIRVRDGSRGPPTGDAVHLNAVAARTRQLALAACCRCQTPQRSHGLGHYLRHFG